MPVDPLAARAFGVQAEEYDRHRPGWPPAAVERALSEFGLGTDAVVADLAAGTGKLTRELLPLAGRVVAVEPLADMRRLLAAEVPGAEALDGTAESMPLADAGVDALFAAEAFHWFATPAAVAEIARVVRPGGGVVLLWNLHDWSHEDWLEAMGTSLAGHLDPGAMPIDRHLPERWQGAFEGAPFTAFEHFEVMHEERTDAAGLIGHVSTWSFVRALDPPARSALLAELREVLEREHPSPDDVALPYRTQVHWARRA